jgi:hypothetical protein
MGVKLLNSSPYYAQANGQAEASKKKNDQKLRRWHSVLNEALWAYRMAPHGATQTSLMNWFMDIMLFYHGRCSQNQEG